MNIFKTLPLLAAALTLLAAPLPAKETLISESVGYAPATIRAGKGTSRAYSVFSLPLSIGSGASWQSSGRLTGLTATTFADAAKTWPQGKWSEAATPWFIRITSGAAAGRSFLLSTATSSTEHTLTLDASEAVDLTTLGIITGEVGDTYVLLAAETLANLFPAEAGVLGGTSAANADTLEINRSGVWTIYYYNGANNAWTETVSGTDASNVVVPPDNALLYGRLANTPINLVLAGSVQGEERAANVKNSGVTLLSNAWPVSVTLADSGIQNLPGWVSSATPASADKVQLHLNGVWQQFFYDGTNWRQIARKNPIKNTELIPATSGVLINRIGAAIGSTVLQQNASF